MIGLQKTELTKEQMKKGIDRGIICFDTDGSDKLTYRLAGIMMDVAREDGIGRIVKFFTSSKIDERDLEHGQWICGVDIIIDLRLDKQCEFYYYYVNEEKCCFPSGCNNLVVGITDKDDVIFGAF